MNILPVKEADLEEEQSDWNNQSFNQRQQDSSQPRFSTESLIGMMTGEPGTEHELKSKEQPQKMDESYSGDNEDDDEKPSKQKLEILKQRAQKLKN